jgi:hypothetical protein
MPHTRASLLEFSVSQGLSHVKVQLGARFYDLGLTPKMREEIAAKVVADMRKHGEWQELDEEIPPGPLSGPR